jgi:RNA polymerase sigma-70 factor (ECF subfamily)
MLNAMESEQELVRACATGDPAAWRRFVDAYAGWVLKVARRVLRGRLSEADAEDATAEVFRWLVEKDRALLKTFGPPFNLKAWLAVLSRRACNRLLRKRMPQPADVEPQAATESRPPLQDLLARLPPEDRVLLLLFFEHECYYEEIAQVLGVSPETVGKQKFRALQKLKELAKKWLP